MRDEYAAHRSFKGIWIPAKMWFNENISKTEKFLLAEIDSLDQGQGCFASDKWLAKFLGVSIGRLKNILTTMRRKGLVKTVSFDGRIRRLRAFYWKPSNPENDEGSSNGKRDVASNENRDSYSNENRDTYNKERTKKINATPRSVRRNGFPSLSLEIEDTPIQKLELSTPVKQFHKFAVKEGYHVHSKNGATQNTIYKKGACNGGWKRPMLAKWESAYQGLKERIQDAKRIQRTLDWYIANYDHPFTPVCQTFLTFAERFDQIDKARRREQKDKTPFRNGEHRNGEHKKQSASRRSDPRAPVISDEDLEILDRIERERS